MKWKRLLQLLGESAPFRRRVGRVSLVGTFVLLASSAEALAQTPIGVGEERGSFPWIVLAGIVVLTAVVAFMNPKRSHLN